MLSGLLKRVVRRADLLSVGLAVVLSSLLYLRYGQPEEQVQTVQGRERILPSEPKRISPAHKKQPLGEPVRFLMFNVHDYFVSKDPPRSARPQRIKPVAEREAAADIIARAHPDLVGLAEIGGRAALEDLAGRLARRGMHFEHRFVLERSGEDRALAFLSVCPITENHSVADCKLVGKTGRYMLRGILDVTVQAKDGRLFRIMGVHFKSRRADDPLMAETQRNREARTLVEHLQHAMEETPAVPILVYGDMNAGPDEPATRTLAQGSRRTGTLRRLEPRDSRGECWTIYYAAGSEYNAFDQIYFNSVLSARVGRRPEAGIADEVGKCSDHRAVWCDLR